jgi:hypothetical protein
MSYDVSSRHCLGCEYNVQLSISYQMTARFRDMRVAVHSRAWQLFPRQGGRLPSGHGHRSIQSTFTCDFFLRMIDVASSVPYRHVGCCQARP